MFSPQQLVHDHLREMDEYVPIKPFEVLSEELGLSPDRIVKLDANENPYGPAPAALDAMAEYPYYHIYPDPEQQALRRAVADAYGIPYDNIAVGCGADELLDYLCRFFLGPGDGIADLPPTFGMYRFDAELAGAHVIEIPRLPDYRVDTSAVAAELTASRERGTPIKIVFVTSPNNPTGTWLSDDDLVQMLELPAMVVLDEAYVDFANRPSRLDWVAENDNLIVLRTFSKALGIAGLRLGFGVFPDWLMPIFWKCKQPYNVGAAATAAGLASLADFEAVEQVALKIRESRRQLLEDLQDIPFLKAFPSEANFVLCQVEGRNALSLWQSLRQRGILLRYYSKAGLEDCIRISIGRPSQMQRLMEELHQLKEG